MTISESSQVVWDCRLPVLQHGEVTTRSQQLSCCVLVVTSPTWHWSSMLRNVWHLAMNRVISLTFPWILGFVWFSTRMVPRTSKMVPRSARHWLIERQCRTGSGKCWSNWSKYEDRSISWESSPNLCWNNATRSWPSWFLPVFSCIFAFWVENLSDNFWRTSICFLSDTANPQSSSINQDTFCNETLKTMTPQPWKPASACCWQAWRHHHSGYSCATTLHATTQFNCIAFNLAARRLSSRWCFYKVFSLKRWTGQPVLHIYPGCFACRVSERQVLHWKPVTQTLCQKNVEGKTSLFVSVVSGDQQHTQHAQAAKKVLAYPILQWNLYQCPSFENSCGLRGWSMVEHDAFFCSPALPGGWHQHLAFWARWAWIWFGHWTMISITHPPGEGWTQSMFAYVCLWVGSGVKFECHFVEDGLRGSVFDGPYRTVTLPMLGLHWEGASVDMFEWSILRPMSGL